MYCFIFFFLLPCIVQSLAHACKYHPAALYLKLKTFEQFYFSVIILICVKSFALLCFALLCFALLCFALLCFAFFKTGFLCVAQAVLELTL